MPIFKRVPAQQPSKVPCPIAFVAPSPDDTERVRGKPLTGPVGRIFDKILRLAGVERADCYIGHVFDEKVPNNDIKSWCQKDDHDDEGPLPHRIMGAGYLRREYHWHLDRLAAELTAVQPAVIVPLGGVALWAFANSIKITDARGAVQRATSVVPGAKILAAFHPMYVQHAYKHLVTTVGDIRKALAESFQDQEQLTQSPRELWLDPTLADIEEFHDRFLLSSSGPFGVDIETGGGQIDCIGFSADSERAICIPFVDYRRVDRNYWPSSAEELAAWKWVQRICDLPQPKLLQNGPYDLFWLLRKGVTVRNWREDTRLLHHSLYPELPKSLSYMGAAYAHEGPWKMTMGRRGDQVKRDA